ncbi:MAG: hypothetical protein Q9220_006920 [cf. Caloplaca sp. 1 TL-2023]
MTSLLIALVVLILSGLVLVAILFVIRSHRKSKQQQQQPNQAHDPPTKRTSNHRRLTISASPYALGEKGGYQYSEKEMLDSPASSAPSSPVPEIRITFPEEEDESGKRKSGRVVIVKISEFGGVGLEPYHDEHLPSYGQADAQRFQSLDIDRIGGLKEVGTEKKIYSASRFTTQDDQAPSPSPTRSPYRRQTPTTRAFDPLLSQLFPTSTLLSLQASTSNDQSLLNALHQSVAAASASEKALAIRAASAGQQLGEWLGELQLWPWPSQRNGFEVPKVSPYSTDGTRNHEYLSERAASEVGFEDVGETGQSYWGSLPAQTVIQYTDRLEEIRDAMEALDLDELKMHVRDAHFLTARRSSNSITAPDVDALGATYNHIDDFTAIVTTIILQALPVTFHLESLIDIWNARLTVLHSVARFTDAMAQTQQEMMAAWDLFNQPVDRTDKEYVSEPFIRGLRSRVESQIRDLGQQLDFMLDNLEGRQDTIPEVWIDNMDALEQEFGDWVVESDKMMVEKNLMHHRSSLHASTTFEKQAPSPSAASHLKSGDYDGSNSESPNIPSRFNNGLIRNGNRPEPLNLQHRRNYSDAPSNFSSDTSYPASATSDYFSDLSSPEIQDASKAEYFGVGSPVEVMTPGLPRGTSRTSEETISRQSSQRTERGDGQSSSAIFTSRSRASTITTAPTIDEDEYTAQLQGADPRPASSSPAKMRHRFQDVVDLSPSNTPVKIIRRKSADAAGALATPQSMKSSSISANSYGSMDDQLEARISSILTDIPANIQLARSSDLEGRGLSRSPAVLDSSISRKSPAPRLARAQTSVPSPPAMTLTPVNPKATRAPNGEPDIKVYHLHQAGHGPPVKLFVRLVGDSGERVMVRIGGGWADLAEYLKEYAIHHGRRTVSGGSFDIRGLPSSQSNSPSTTLGPLNGSQTPAPLSDKPSASRSSSGMMPHRPFSNGSVEPSSPIGKTFNSSDFRPTSRDSNASSKHSWAGDDSPSLGLAGPKSRKATVSPNKQAWVDTMMEKARSGSGEKKGKRDGFGRLGIVGGTKRLFLKGVLSIDSIFDDDYDIQSATPNNTINLQISLTHLNRALRSAVTASSAFLRLTKKDNIPLLSLTILTTTFTSFRPNAALDQAASLPSESIAANEGEHLDATNEDSSLSLPHADSEHPSASSNHHRERTITQSVPVTVLAPASVANIHEPTCREPDVHIMLPPLLQLKSISERFTRLALPPSNNRNSNHASFTNNLSDANTRLTLSASAFGDFKIGVSTSALKIESKWSGLTNPELDPSQVEGGEEGVRDHASTRLKEKGRDAAWATVRVEARDWGRVLGVGRLGGRVVACFCDEHALILYVYLQNEENGADDSVLTPMTTFPISRLFGVIVDRGKAGLRSLHNFLYLIDRSTITVTVAFDLSLDLL